MEPARTVAARQPVKTVGIATPTIGVKTWEPEAVADAGGIDKKAAGKARTLGNKILF